MSAPDLARYCPVAALKIIAATFFAFKNVGYPKIKILINDRQILFETLKSFTNSKINIFSIIQSIDKIDKDRPEKVQKELVDKGIESKEKARNAIDSLVNTKISSTLQKIIDFSVMLGVPKEVIEFKPVLARGLDYYTGMIFEVSLPGYNVGSCGGGGRYDKLIGQLSGNEIPAVGIAFGFDRMVEAAEYFGIISNKNQSNQVLVTIFNKDLLGNSLNIAGELRKNKITTEVYPAEDRIDKQLKYANKKNIRYVIIIGPEEVGKGIVVLKDMKTGEQAKLTIEDVIKLLSND